MPLPMPPLIYPAAKLAAKEKRSPHKPMNMWALWRKVNCLKSFRDQFIAHLGGPEQIGGVKIASAGVEKLRDLRLILLHMMALRINTKINLLPEKKEHVPRAVESGGRRLG